MLRRTPLKRGKPLKRKTWMRSRSKTNSYRRRERDIDFMTKVRKLGCVVRYWIEMDDVGPFKPDGKVTPCTGRVEADHLGRRALGQKATDDTCASLCQAHHGERTDVRGMFKNWTAYEMRTWCDWAIQYTQREVAGMK